MSNGCGITFQNGTLWSFDNETNRESVLILGVDNSKLSHPANQKKKLRLGQGPTFVINEK